MVKTLRKAGGMTKRKIPTQKQETVVAGGAGGHRRYTLRLLQGCNVIGREQEKDRRQH